MAILFCFASCDNGAVLGFVLGSGEDTQDSQSSINYSLGDPPQSDQLPKDKYSIDEEISEGIYIEFDIPTSENYWTTRVYIEGLGQVAEEVQYTDQSKTKGCFYYPFVEAEKEYTIRFVFLRDEDKNKDGFVIDYQGDDGTLGWFQTKVTAGAQSKGEVRLKYKGAIEVKNTGDFRFTKKPEFYGESALTGKDYDGKDYDWKENIGLVEGISWEHGDAHKTKWRAEFPIPNAKLTKWCNLYTDAGTKGWKDSKFIKIDFLCIRPCLEYNYDGKQYKYQWESFCYETPYLGDEALLWTIIDITKSEDVKKIQGTWKISEYWEEDFNVDDNNHRIPIKCEWTEIYIINNDQSIQDEFIEIYTKIDGSAFTEEEKGYWENYKYKDSRDTIEVSNYKVIGKVTETSTLSEFFKNENSDGTYSNKLNLFKDGKILRIIDDYKDYDYYDLFRQ